MAETKSQILGFNTSHLNDQTFKNILKGINDKAILLSWCRFAVGSRHGIVADARTSGSLLERITGFHGFKLKYTIPGDEEVHSKNIVLKSKQRGKEVIEYFSHVIPNLEEDAIKVWKAYLEMFLQRTTDYKEILCVQMQNPAFVSIMPDIYWSLQDEHKDIFVFAMEYFDPDEFYHLDTLEDISVWKEDEILEVLKSLACMHAVYYENIDNIPKDLVQHLTSTDTKYLMKLVPMMKKILETNNPYCENEMWNNQQYNTIQKILEKYDNVCAILEHAPRTLIHNDFCLRNFCLRKKPAASKFKVCVYDWELVCIGQPQHDLADCLLYFLQPTTDLSTWNFYIEKYLTYLHLELEKANPGSVSKSQHLNLEEFTKVFDMSVIELLTNHYGTFLSTAYRKFKFPQAKTVYQTGMNYIQGITNRYSFLLL